MSVMPDQVGHRIERVSRRDFLQASGRVALLAGSGLLTACQSQPSASPAVPPTSPAAPAQAAPAAASPSPAASPAAGPSPSPSPAAAAGPAAAGKPMYQMDAQHTGRS